VSENMDQFLEFVSTLCRGVDVFAPGRTPIMFHSTSDDMRPALYNKNVAYYMGLLSFVGYLAREGGFTYNTHDSPDLKKRKVVARHELIEIGIRRRATHGQEAYSGHYYMLTNTYCAENYFAIMTNIMNLDKTLAMMRTYKVSIGSIFGIVCESTPKSGRKEFDENGDKIDDPDMFKRVVARHMLLSKGELCYNIKDAEKGSFYKGQYKFPRSERREEKFHTQVEVPWHINTVQGATDYVKTNTPLAKRMSSLRFKSFHKLSQRRKANVGPRLFLSSPLVRLPGVFMFTPEMAPLTPTANVVAAAVKLNPKKKKPIVSQ